MRRTVRRLVWGLAVLGALGGLVWLLLPVPIPVDLAVVERGPMRVTVDEEGRTRVRDRYVVSTPLAGRLRRIELEAGDTVEAGDVVARVDPPSPEMLDERTLAQARAGVDAAEAAVERAEALIQRTAAELAYAEWEYERNRRLYASEAATRRELEQAELELRIAREQMGVARWDRRVAEHQLAQARAVLAVTAEGGAHGEGDPILIRAPAGARILRVYHKSEGFLGAGTALVEVGDPRRLEVVADFLTEQAARVEPGAAVYMERWGGAAPLRGRVRLVEPGGFTDISALGVEEQRVNVVIDFEEPAEAYARLGDGYRVDVRIVTWEGDDVLQVPTGALFREGEQWMVFVLREGRAVRRPVRIGHQTALQAEVIEGLEEGERVLLYPGDRVEETARITPRR